MIDSTHNDDDLMLFFFLFCYVKKKIQVYDRLVCIFFLVLSFLRDVFIGYIIVDCSCRSNKKEEITYSV